MGATSRIVWRVCNGSGRERTSADGAHFLKVADAQGVVKFNASDKRAVVRYQNVSEQRPQPRQRPQLSAVCVRFPCFLGGGLVRGATFFINPVSIRRTSDRRSERSLQVASLINWRSRATSRWYRVSDAEAMAICGKRRKSLAAALPAPSGIERADRRTCDVSASPSARGNPAASRYIAR